MMTGCVDPAAQAGATKFEKRMNKWNKRLAADRKAGRRGGEHDCHPRSVKFGRGTEAKVLGDAPVGVIHWQGFRTLAIEGSDAVHVYTSSDVGGIQRERAFYDVATELVGDIIPRRYRVDPVGASNECKLRLVQVNQGTADTLASVAIPAVDPETRMLTNPNWCPSVAKMTVTAVGMLQQVHQLGLVHGMITRESFGMNGWRIQYLLNFFHAAPWVNVRKGEPWDHRIDGEDIRSGLIAADTDHHRPAFRRDDMIALGAVFSDLLGDDPTTCAGRVREAIANFNAEMGSLEFSSAPNYAHWIETFRRLA